MNLAARELNANLSAVMASYIYLATDDLIRRPIMDAGKPSKSLAALGALQVSMCVIFYYHVDITFYELPASFLLVDVEKLLALRAMNLNRVCICHDAS